MPYKKLTQEEKDRRKEERKDRKELEREIQLVKEKNNQRPIKKMVIMIEWKKSRWGHNPHAQTEVIYQGDEYPKVKHKDGYTCSGCGYDKESAVIAKIFNDFLAYKLYSTENFNKIVNEKSAPCGIGHFTFEKFGRKVERLYFPGGVGTSCYYEMAKFFNDKFEKIASGKIFDVFVYTCL